MTDKEEFGGFVEQLLDNAVKEFRATEQETLPIGKYGLLRKTYIKNHRKIIYTNLLTAGTLHNHLAEIDAQANDMLELLMKQMAAAQGVDEQLKAENQMLWVGKMSNIKACAEEIVLKEIVYA